MSFVHHYELHHYEVIASTYTVNTLEYTVKYPYNNKPQTADGMLSP